MSDDITIQGPNVTIGFKRVLRLRDYENAEASVFIQVPTVPGDTVTQITENMKLTFAAAKASVFEQLGIPFEVDPVDLVVKELLEKHLGGVEVTGAQAQVVNQAQANQPTTSTKSFGGGGSAAPTSKAGLWQELASDPKKWFDNRTSKKSDKGPDFKRKYSGETLWLTYNGASNVPDGITIPDATAF